MTSSQQGTARLVITLQLLAVVAALLLSIPTPRASRRAARAQSRIVGRVADEPIVLPRHAEDRELLEDVPVGAIEDPQDEPA